MTAAKTDAMEAAFSADGGIVVLVGIASLQSSFHATAANPAITVPTGRRDDGEPAGIALIRKKGRDARLLAFAYASKRAAHARIVVDLP